MRDKRTREREREENPRDGERRTQPRVKRNRQWEIRVQGSSGATVNANCLLCVRWRSRTGCQPTAPTSTFSNVWSRELVGCPRRSETRGRHRFVETACRYFIPLIPTTTQSNSPRLTTVYTAFELVTDRVSIPLVMRREHINPRGRRTTEVSFPTVHSMRKLSKTPRITSSGSPGQTGPLFLFVPFYPLFPLPEPSSYAPPSMEKVLEPPGRWLTSPAFVDERERSLPSPLPVREAPQPGNVALAPYKRTRERERGEHNR